jgi:hypothetical protein
MEVFNWGKTVLVSNIYELLSEVILYTIQPLPESKSIRVKLNKRVILNNSGWCSSSKAMNSIFKNDQLI